MKPVRWRHRPWRSNDLAGEPVMLVLSILIQWALSELFDARTSCRAFAACSLHDVVFRGRLRKRKIKHTKPLSAIHGDNGDGPAQYELEQPPERPDTVSHLQ